MTESRPWIGVPSKRLPVRVRAIVSDFNAPTLTKAWTSKKATKSQYPSKFASSKL